MVHIQGFDQLELIGVGANARVYAGRDIDHDRPVAIKLIQPGTDLEAIQRRFNRERKALGRLSQVTNVVTIYHSGITSDGEPFLVMPRLESSLQDMVESGGVSWRNACQMMRGVATAIERAHGMGILHLDLKPANILMDVDRQPQVADFGIAEFVGSTASKSGALLTPDYSAPERFEDATPDESMDVYALGGCLFALIAGHPPFSDATTTGPAAVMRRVMNDPVPIDLLPADVPDAVVSLITRSLEKDARDRPANAAEFAGALDAALGVHLGEPAQSSRSADTIPFDVTDVERPSRRVRTPVVALIAACVVGLAAVAVLSNDPDDDRVDVDVAGETESQTTTTSDTPETSVEPAVTRSRTLTINEGVQEYIETTLLGSGGSRVEVVDGDPRGEVKTNGEYIHVRESDAAYTFSFVVHEFGPTGALLAEWNIRVTVAAKLDHVQDECPALEIQNLAAEVESAAVVVVTWATNTPATELVRSQAEGATPRFSNPSGNFYEDFTHRLGDLAWSGVEPLSASTSYDFWVTLTSQCDPTDSITETISFVTAAE